MGLFLALGFPLLLAQSPATAIRGAVSDEATGEPIPGALVELTDIARRTYTDTAGRFEVGVAAGSYELRVSRLGYASRSLAVLVPAVGNLELDVTLTALPAELVRVRVVDTIARGVRRRDDAEDALSPGSRFRTADDVRDQPLLAEPDFLLALASDADVAIAPEGPTAFHVRGGSADQNLVLLDGVPVYSPVHGTGSFSTINPDALDAIALHAGVMPARLGGALSSVIEARSRDPDLSGVHARGSLSLTGARVMVEGPLPGSRIGFLVSGRWGTPALFGAPGEETFLRSAATDLLAKVTTPLAGGQFQAVTLVAGDRAGFAARFATPGPIQPDDLRHDFEWGSGTTGVRWHRSLGSDASLTLGGWRASYEAEIGWEGAAAPIIVGSSRTTEGVDASVSMRGRRSWLRVGVEGQRDRAGYAVRTASATPPDSTYAANGSMEMFSAFVDERIEIGGGWQLLSGARGSLVSSDALLFEPRVALVAQLQPGLSFGLGVARAHQTVQSLGNPESPVQNVFGADLPFLANEDIARIARSDQVTATLSLARGSAFHATFDAYLKRLEGLALVAPVTSRPFAADSAATGSGRIIGLALATDWRHQRLAVATTAGLSRSIARSQGSTYQPGYAPELSMSSGVSYRSSQRMTWRAAMTARSGRRATRFEGPLRWEGCDPLDGGCEIVGTPERAAGALGAARLPTYLRFDLGARRAWEIPMRGRAPRIEAYATASNVLGRRNVWALVADPETGEPRSIPMRPFSLLSAGLDWRF